MIKNKKILIVGAGGFIGGHLVNRLLKDGNSIVACEEIGLDLSEHRSTAITRATVENASAIFCMTESHRALLHMYFELPEDAPIFLMREFVEEGSKELPDPYGQNLEVYRACREDMKEAIRLYRQAARQRWPRALYTHGFLYHKGKGGPQGSEARRRIFCPGGQA